MDNKFVLNYMIIYIEREIVDNIDLNAITNKFFLKNYGTELC